MPAVWEDDGRPANQSPAEEHRFLLRRRRRRVVQIAISTAVFVVAIVVALRLVSHDVPSLRVLLIIAFGCILGGVFNAAFGIAQLASTSIQLRAVRTELQFLQAEHREDG